MQFSHDKRFSRIEKASLQLVEITQSGFQSSKRRKGVSD